MINKWGDTNQAQTEKKIRSSFILELKANIYLGINNTETTTFEWWKKQEKNCMK